MSEQKPNEPMSFNRFADWCTHIDSLSEGARHTVEVLLKKAGTDDVEAAERILSSMRKLDLSEHGITDISSLGSLTNLTTLYLSSNQIKDISSLGSLTNLTTLILYCNRITDISSLASLTNLTTLNLQTNQIKDISSLGSLTNLTKLDLGCNRSITDISSLGLLTNLTTLDLDENRITDISSLGSLINLTKLIIDHNRITDISALRELVNLTEIDLHDNPITDINALRSLTNLTKLDLRQTTFDFHNRKREIIDISVLGEFTQKRLALSTKPIDAEKATEAVKIAYTAIGLEAPEVIICSSPRDAYLQIFNLLKCDRSQNCSNEWRWNISGQKLGRKMFSSVAREFTSRVMWMYERFHLIGGFESQADGALRLLMHELVDSYARSEETMGNSYPDHLLSLKSPETPPTLLKAIYSTELYLSLSGINLSEKAQKIHLFQKLLLEHCGFIFPFEKICAVCDRPRHLRFDSQNRLHAEGEPAIEFADGWNFYYYHGVRLPEQYGQVHPNLWKAEWLLSEDNAELKRVLIEAIGYDRIIQELSAQQIDIWQKYALLQIDNADVEPIYLLKMTCPSTGFIHALRVPPDLTSAREAIRWVNGGIDPEEFSVQT